jgi:hypothetical protein
MTQKHLRFVVSRLAGESLANHQHRQRALNLAKPAVATPPEKLFADLLKRQARRIMADITECPPETIPAHMARLDDLRELIKHATTHELIPGNETLLSGKQLILAATVADFLACLEITRRQHRAPAFVNDREEALERIERKLDTLAGCFAKSAVIDAVLNEAIEADEKEEA